MPLSWAQHPEVRHEYGTSLDRYPERLFPRRRLGTVPRGRGRRTGPAGAGAFPRTTQTRFPRPAYQHPSRRGLLPAGYARFRDTRRGQAAGRRARHHQTRAGRFFPNGSPRRPQPGGHTETRRLRNDEPHVHRHERVRAARNHGYDITLLHDACATRDLSWNGKTIPAATVHEAFMAALHGAFADVRTTGDFLPSLPA